ncbi:MAG TPA: TIM barrel protein [Tepidisphaeraceae bacterium]|nr:TIM barrel protein [Tepidisphaeraceae bacterium]
MTSRTIQIAAAASALNPDPRQAPRVARAMGFAGIEFDAHSPSFDIPALSGSGRREFLRMISSQDLKLAGLRADLGPKGFGIGADIDRLLSRFDEVLESAASLACPLVYVDLGPLPAPGRQERPRPAVTQTQAGLILLPNVPSVPRAAPIDSPPPDPAFVAQVDCAMAELGHRADRYSVIVAFSSDLASLAALDRAVVAASCPWFGIDLDPSSILRDEWSVDEVFSRLGQLVRHVRGRDAVAGGDRRARPAVIGAGSTDWPVLLACLDSIGNQGWLTVDPSELADRSAAAEAGLKWLGKCLGSSFER